MDRRSFLALIASAPIAALAPWPKILATPKLAFHPKVFEFVMAPLDAGAFRLLAPAVTGGPVGEALFGPVYRSGDVALDMPAEAARVRQALADAIDAS